MAEATPIPIASVTERVHAALRADLLACRLAPGQKLKIDELCRRFGVGSSAVREALSRLVSEGFVDSEPQRGFRVKPLSLDELRDLTDTRCQIEGLCIADSLARGDLEWETHLIASLHRLSRTPVQAEGDQKRYGEAFAVAHQAFHQALVAACRSPWLLKLRTLLSIQHERYRWLSRPLARIERDLDTEHRAIAAAAVARDGPKTVALMDEHLRQTARIIIEAGSRTIETPAASGPAS